MFDLELIFEEVLHCWNTAFEIPLTKTKILIILKMNN